MRIQIPFLLLILILSGCATKPTPDFEAIPTTKPVAPYDSLPSKTELIEAMDIASKLQLGALSIENRDFVHTRLVLSSIDFTQLNRIQQSQYGLIIAELYIRTGNTQEALLWLTGEKSFVFDQVDTENQIKVSQWRSTAWEYSGQFLAAARERIFLSPILDEEQNAINHELIWADLQFVSTEELLQLTEIDDGSLISGWAALAYANIETGRDIELQVIAINQWQLKNKGHPAANKLPGGLDLLRTLVAERPKHIGIMLPLSGPNRKSGEAIKNGFMAAYYQAITNGRTTPKVTFVDTDKVKKPESAYELLIAEGAQLIIGPLEKAKVRSLQASKNLQIPVMALNTSEQKEDRIDNFYQFGLNPEEEAVQVAIRANKLGYKRAAILVPANSWGERIYESFKDEFNIAGGNVVSQVKYAKTENRELLQVVRKLLNLDASIQRTAIVEKIIDEDVEYEPRRRKDIDFILLASVPSHARQIKPLLDFQYASEIPVLGVSTIYSGKVDPELDKDIENIQFLDIPWQIESTDLKQRIYSVYGELNVIPYNRLYALGADVFQIYPRIRQLSQNTGSRIHGYTGVLSMDSQGRIKRQLSWAKIQNGVASPISNIPETIE